MLNPLTHPKILKKGLPGTANVVTRGVYSPNASSFNLAMTLQVYVEGITPYEVEDNWMVKAKDTVALGGAMPVRVDRTTIKGSPSTGTACAADTSRRRPPGGRLWRRAVPPAPRRPAWPAAPR